jgi:hypothetical protein
MAETIDAQVKAIRAEIQEILPTHVALPRGVDPASLKLWRLRLVDRPAPPGTVIVGREAGNRG